MRPAPPASPRSLVARARGGEADAREELAQQAGDAAYVFALQLTRSAEVARDVAQDSVFRLFRHLDRFDESQRLEPWLYSIVRNLVRDAARREQVRRHESLDTWLEAGGREPVASEDPVWMAEQRELRHRVWRGISALPAAHREILVLRDYHGLSYREMAAVLSIPDGTVMSRLHAARRRLRAILIEQGGDPRADTDTTEASP